MAEGPRERERSGDETDPRGTLLHHAVTAAGIGTFEWNLVTGTLTWDDRLLELFGYAAGEFDETIDDFNARVHPDDLPEVERLLRHSIDNCTEYEAEYRITLAGQQLRWVHARGRVICQEDGTPVRLLGSAWDVTSRHVALRSAAEAARRSELLAAVASELTEHLDADVAVARLARLVVPPLADWCIVTLVDDNSPSGSPRGLRDVASWHADENLRPLVERYTTRRMVEALHPYLRAALTASRPVVIPPNAGEAIRAALPPGAAGEAIAQLAPQHGVLLPLRARGRTVGVLSMYRGPGRTHFSDEDLTTAMDVAARAGLALDNSRLYRQQRHLAETLQRAMLTAPPQPDDLQIVVRYTPAAEAAHVGGDWYDAFLQPGGATVLVIGDVVGHDVLSAAAMGQIRTIVRALGARTDQGPAELLSQADQVLRTLQLETAATAVTARLEQTPGEYHEQVTRLKWSNAGHPPPLVLHADGRVEVLSGTGADLLLGVRPDARRRETEMVLDRGSVVLLYTDGLIERRGQPLDQGLDMLEHAVAELGREDLDRFCDDLLARLLPDHPEDDVALVAVRLHPQVN